VKGIGVAVRGFLFENAFWLRDFPFEIGPRAFDSQAGQERGTPSCLLQDATQTSGSIGKVNFGFDSVVYQNFNFDFITTYPPKCAWP
jgi:hypothetical protein